MFELFETKCAETILFQVAFTMEKLKPFLPWESFFGPLDLYSYHILTTLYYFYTITPPLSLLHVPTHPPATSRELSSIFL